MSSVRSDVSVPVREAAFVADAFNFLRRRYVMFLSIIMETADLGLRQAESMKA